MANVLLPATDRASLHPRHPHAELLFQPQRPFRGRFLFLDGVPALMPGLVVADLDIGHCRAWIAASAAGVPARVFELRQLATTLGDAAGLIARGETVRIEVNEEAHWPLQLDLPPVPVGVYIRARLDATNAVWPPTEFVSVVGAIAGVEIEVQRVRW